MHLTGADHTCFIDHQDLVFAEYISLIVPILQLSEDGCAFYAAFILESFCCDTRKCKTPYSISSGFICFPHCTKGIAFPCSCPTDHHGDISALCDVPECFLLLPAHGVVLGRLVDDIPLKYMTI